MSTDPPTGPPAPLSGPLPDPPTSGPVGSPASGPVGSPASGPVGSPASGPVGSPASGPVGSPADPPAGAGGRIVLVVDVANVMGSRPDGWWRDRAAAATRVLSGLAALRVDQHPAAASGVDVLPVSFGRIVAVLEGRARPAAAPAGVEVVRAPADGDSAIVVVAGEVLAAGDVPLVVTADRGLRDRLPAGCRVAGPSRLWALLPG